MVEFYGKPFFFRFLSGTRKSRLKSASISAGRKKYQIAHIFIRKYSQMNKGFGLPFINNKKGS